jgi:hypothetical protein
MRKVFMPAGRAAADRRIVGCWMHQRGDLLFIGIKNPSYWISSASLKEMGVDWWAAHLRGKAWFDKDGWTPDEVERDFRLIVKEVYDLVSE